VYFAWQKALRGPVPIKFDSDLKPKGLLIVYKLNDQEAEMNLTELAYRYPYKEIT
jgi:hypothetical protein